MPNSGISRALREAGVDQLIIDSFDELLLDDEIDDKIDQVIDDVQNTLDFIGTEDLDEEDIRDIISDELESDIENRIDIFIRGRIENPDFDSQDFFDSILPPGIEDKLLDKIIQKEVDRTVSELLEEDLISGQVVIYRTQQDSKVDDLICLPLEGESYTIGDEKRVIIPDDTHPNCRCFYEDALTGENLGQF